jgi:hypothetical protein
MLRAMTVVAVAAIALTGCTAIAPPAPLPDPLSDDEVAQILQVDADIRWSVLEALVDGAPRPEVEFVAYSTPETWAEQVAECMRDSGVDSAQVREGTGLTYRGDGPGERIVFYGCSVAYPLDPRAEGYLSEAQRGYAWDYWANRTVPCLLGLGYPVPGVPERDAFIARSLAGTSWNPYLLISDPDAPWSAIDGACPPLQDPYPTFH